MWFAHLVVHHLVKLAINSMEHELDVQRHHISTIQSSSAIATSSEKSKYLDAQAKITELERLLKVREHANKEDQARLRELEETLQREKSGSQRRAQDLNEDLR